MTEFLAEVKVYNRRAPGAVFAGADAADLALAPLNGYYNLSVRCCRLELAFSLGVGVFAR